MITKINPFVQIYEALRGFTDPDAFYNLRKQSTGSKITFSLIISVLAALMVCGFTVFNIITDKKLESALTTLPDFSYVNGEFYCEQVYALPSENKYLILNSEIEKWDSAILQQQSLGNATQGYQDFQNALNDSSITEIILISKTNMVSYKKYTGQFSEMTLSELFNIFGITTVSKQSIIDGYKGLTIKAGLLCSLFVFPYQLIKLFFVALILSLIALIINAICGSNEQFSTLYWISFYMQSIILLIKIIGDSFLNFGGFTLTIACFLFYICMMYRTLKSGEPTAKATTSYNTNNDLDEFLQGSYTTTETVKSPFDTQDADTFPYDTDASPTPHNNDASFHPHNMDTFNNTDFSNTSLDDTSENTEPPKPSSGLSLKLKDD